jgi:sodium-dependent dicarboxylate transporter 2/3/5
MRTETASEAEPPAVRDYRGLHLIAGPLAFVLLLGSPGLPMTYAVRCGFGLLLWTAWWWITRPVHLAVTGLLPLVIVALTNFVPVTEVLPSYADELVVLLLGANILSVAWQRWGLDRRIALASLIGVGTSAVRQIIVWFLVSAALSAFLPRSVVAATMVPIVIAMMRYIGITDLWNSRLGTSLVLAVAWGASSGGFLTPLGGAPNLLAMKLVESNITHHEFLFVTWAARLLPLSIAVIGAILLYVRFAFRSEITEAPGSRDYFNHELRALGSMTPEEKWGSILFGLATILAFTRQLYAESLPGMSPAFTFLAFGLSTFLVRVSGRQLLSWEYAQKEIMWGLLCVFAGGSALGAIMTKSGTAQYLADLIRPFLSESDVAAIILVTALTLAIAQIVSNVATVAITVPIVISVFTTAGKNPIPYVYVVVAAGHCGFMLPSSAGSSAIAAGYGVNLKTMFVEGFRAALVCLVVIAGLSYLLMLFWPPFGQA